MPRKEPKLTDEERQKISEKYSIHYDSQEDLDFQIALALDHDAAMKAGNSGSWNLYVRNWLNREIKFTPKGNQNGRTERDPALHGL